MIQGGDLERIMRSYNAEYVLFVNWYNIKKNLYTGVGNEYLGKPFSLHYVDYDVYDLEKNKITWGHKVEIEQTADSVIIKEKGLGVNGLTKGYQGLLSRICGEINQQ